MKTIIAITLLFTPGLLVGQLLTTQPAFPIENDAVTIFFDAAKGSGGLKDCRCPIYLHTGVITDKSVSGSDWKYVQTSWGVANPTWEMLPVAGSPDVFSYAIKPSIRSFYKVPPGEKILQLAFVFRNANGSREGKDVGLKDIFYPVYENAGFSGFLQEPRTPGKWLAPGDSFQIQAVFSRSARITLWDNDSLVYTTTNAEFRHSWIPRGEGMHRVAVLARTDGGDTTSLSTQFLVLPEPRKLMPPPETLPGLRRLSSGKIRIAVEASGKKHLFLLGDFNSWKVHPDFLFNKSPTGEIHWIELDGIPRDQPFLYQLASGELERFADPYARLVLDPAHDRFISPQVFPGIPPYPSGKTTGIVALEDSSLHAYTWKTAAFRRPAASDLVIYELHMRDFMEAPSYAKLLDTLPYLIRLGINAIQFMPVNEFEGNNSWGYNPSYHFALDKYYGTPSTFKAFIDACHQAGIAVILDVVLNHAFSQSPLCRLFWDDSNGRPSQDNPWLNPTPRHDYNVGYDFNHESPLTRAFAKRVMSYWLREFRVDGFRFDLSKGFTQRNTLGNTAAWGRYDASRIAIWQDYANHLRQEDPETYIILEHFADQDEEVELARNGMLLWGNMNYAFNEATMGYLSNLSALDAQARGFPLPAVVNYMESHDEERLMVRNLAYGRSSQDYDTRRLATALRRMEMAFAFFLLSPGPKMIWQFGEMGFDYSINTCEDGRVNPQCRLSPKPVPWSLASQPGRKRLLDMVGSILRLRREFPVFRQRPVDAQWTAPVKHMHFRHTSMDALVMANTDVAPRDISLSGLRAGKWYGWPQGDSISLPQGRLEITLLPGEYRVYTTTLLPRPPLGYGTTAMRETLAETADWTVFPNPASRQLYMACKGGCDLAWQWHLTDMLGRPVFGMGAMDVIELGNFRILNLGDLPAGPYLLVGSHEREKITYLVTKAD